MTEIGHGCSPQPCYQENTQIQQRAPQGHQNQVGASRCGVNNSRGMQGTNPGFGGGCLSQIPPKGMGPQSTAQPSDMSDRAFAQKHLNNPQAQSPEELLGYFEELFPGEGEEGEMPLGADTPEQRRETLREMFERIGLDALGLTNSTMEQVLGSANNLMSSIFEELEGLQERVQSGMPMEEARAEFTGALKELISQTLQGSQQESNNQQGPQRRQGPQNGGGNMNMPLQRC